jgi:putative ABC transport system permease protein
MNVLDSLRSALEALRANKTRSALTLLGMVIGVFAVIAAVTAVDVVDLYFQQSIRVFGTSTFSVERYADGGFGRDRDEYHPPITYDQVERLTERVEGGLVVSVSERFDGAEAVRFQERETEPNVSVYGTDQAFLRNFGFDLAAGRPFTEQDVRYGRAVALLGAPIAEELFPNQTPLGKTITAGRTRLEVVGVLEEKGSFLGFDPNSRVYAPVTHLFTAYGNNGRSMGSVSVRAPSPAQVNEAKEAVVSDMRVIRGVGPGEPNNFGLSTNESIRSTFDQFTFFLTVGGAAIGLISLLAAGVGIMNIMLVSVTERTKEIGIRKAVGAKERHIMLQFLLEALILCQIGGLLGILFGGLGGNAVAVFFGISPSFPWTWALLAVGGVALIALTFGVYPAYKAAQLDPIESLRFE